MKGLVVVLVITILILAGIGATAVTYAVKNLLIALLVVGVIFLLIVGSLSKDDEEEDDKDSNP